MASNYLIWNASIEELKRGYKYNNESSSYICLICEKTYRDGEIYKCGDRYLEAKLMIKEHIKKEHDSMLKYLLSLDKRHTGLTEHQRKLIEYFYEDYSDKEIVHDVGMGSTSTIRNHRFKLKEREKQAKLFLAIMGILNDKDKSKKIKGMSNYIDKNNY
ncbi:helix-turn-helix transcriptional regulator [Clostridiisalibacter paucivorans]|uniref:helix-turn-helix transcriptional regulator n=1 Tax=Clostridiisalibacter paucivorans TaxID=408753 RepID=UPI000685B3D6|nr:hypothetical protein [Clostridiisalibacter paucivorans]